MQAIENMIYQILTVYGLKVLAALVILVVGRWVAKGIRKLVERLMTRNKVDATLIAFTASLVYIGLLAFIVLAALGPTSRPGFCSSFSGPSTWAIISKLPGWPAWWRRFTFSRRN
jgi:small-conductance mechanosensitive channel